jgi:hypothetical protein
MGKAQYYNLNIMPQLQFFLAQTISSPALFYLLWRSCKRMKNLLFLFLQ